MDCKSSIWMMVLAVVVVLVQDHFVEGQPILGRRNMSQRSLDFNTEYPNIPSKAIARRDKVQKGQSKPGPSQGNTLNVVPTSIPSFHFVRCSGNQPWAGSKCFGKRWKTMKENNNKEKEWFKAKMQARQNAGIKDYVNKKAEESNNEMQKRRQNAQEYLGKKCKKSRGEQLPTQAKRQEKQKEWRQYQQMHSKVQKEEQRTTLVKKRQVRSIGQQPQLPDHHIVRKLEMVNPTVATDDTWCQGDAPCGNLPW